MKVYEKINELKGTNSTPQEMIDWAYMNRIDPDDFLSESELKDIPKELSLALGKTYNANYEAWLWNFLNYQIEDDTEGLKIKYVVTKVKDGSVVNECFVLRPQKDESARAALKAYAYATPNYKLKKDILQWLKAIESEGK